MGKNKHKRKQPALAKAPPEHGKNPRMGVHDPGIEAVRKPAWRFQYLDLEGPFGWKRCAEAQLEPVLKALQNYETMNWDDIQQKKSCHSSPVPELCKEARARRRHRHAVPNPAEWSAAGVGH